MQPSDNLNDSRYEWTSRVLGGLLGDHPSKLVLDIGAGDGRMQAAIEAAGGQYRGFDLFPACPQIDRWDLDEPSPSGLPPAAGALLMDVIEHCDNPGLALRHIAASLCPGGFLVLTTPNPRWSRSRLFALASGTPACFTQSDLDLNHHVFTPWPHILEHLLTTAGFQVERRVTLDGKTPWPWRPFNFRYPVRVLAAAVMKAIERRDASACGLSYGLIARKLA